MDSRTILICDDDESMRKLIGAVLAPEGYELREASSADHAAAGVADADLVILDVHMPGRNGLSVLDSIRADSSLNGPKVLLVSGTAEAFDAGWAEEVGADAHLPKPFDTATLRSTVRDLLAEPG